MRWVLGEQSARQLSGAKMEDVIFSGTQSRRPMGFAYVAITFENANRIISLDYEEVTVARRVYRSGESEYLLLHQTTHDYLRSYHLRFSQPDPVR